MDRPEQLRQYYNLLPHPEGGSFSEVYTAPYMYEENREIGGSIYFMLEKDDISHFHQIDVDEIWYYHEGCAMRIYMIDGTGKLLYEDLGPDMENGEHMMVVIPKGVIFAAENKDKESYCFVSCATMPQFQYAGFRLVAKTEVQIAEELNRLFMDEEKMEAREL